MKSELKLQTIKITQIPLEDRILLLGPPGVGKTEVVRQKAEREAETLGRRFVDLRNDNIPNDLFQSPQRYYVFIRIVAPHIFPEDLGIPQHRGEFVEFLLPKVLKVFTLKDIAGTVFLDELTNVPREDQISMYYSLILEKEAGWTLKINDNVKIIAAGNPPEWAEISRPLPKPLRNRMTIIHVSPPSVEEWAAYMQRRYGDNWERLAALYLAMYPEDILKPPEDEFSAFPTPRSWTSVALLLHKYNEASWELKESLIVGNLGDDVGVKFAALLKTRLDISEALRRLEEDPKYFDRIDLNQRLLLLDAVARQPVDRLTGPLRGFLAHLATTHREMLVLLVVIMSKEKRIAVITKMPDLFIKVANEISRYV
ncbi:ATPase family associated with various cellular activities (AAA) [Pyrobaculum oguniense TE7]|uniref:ATPase family associated with various cellular activities (AAA) n=1 Tax=Pyrobaculum oguniense (strain DSM 13380 / JCM 10595 / TE7) TaxID=698757 RepID=H6QCW3_PYROT|nr:ATPase family associated with various cellular activities (AAA) [Pyrobaculum oguniense TE7]